jgi:NADPH:quinone reductase-like Zn-dependent oxidoreductase/predicted ester cyclase
MEAYILEQNGGLENLKRSTLSTPDLKAGEVLIETKAIGINSIDIQVRNSNDILSMITGGNIPKQVILGWDVAGVIVKVAEGVTEFKVGDEVFGLLNMPGLGGTYATQVAANASQLVYKPAGTDFIEAAAVPMAALTAWQAIVTLGQVKAGDKVLIYGASGGVGHFAVQFAKQRGAYVIGVASGKNESFVRSLGVDEFIDYTAQPVDSLVKELDVVMDTVNSVEHLLSSIQLVKKGGRFVYLQPHFAVAIQSQLEAAEVNGLGVFVNSSGEHLTTIAKLIADGKVIPRVTSVFDFDELPAAQAAVEFGNPTGKVVVSVSTPIKALTKQEIEAIHAFYSVFSNRDYRILDKVLAPDWQDIPLAPGQEDGPEGYINLVKGFTQAFPDVSITVHEIFGSHERAGVRAEMSFTHSSEFMGIAPTHQKLTITLHEFHHLSAGKLTKTWHLEDWLSMLLQTGAWPPKSN